MRNFSLFALTVFLSAPLWAQDRKQIGVQAAESQTQQTENGGPTQRGATLNVFEAGQRDQRNTQQAPRQPPPQRRRRPPPQRPQTPPPPQQREQGQSDPLAVLRTLLPQCPGRSEVNYDPQACDLARMVSEFGARLRETANQVASDRWDQALRNSYNTCQRIVAELSRYYNGRCRRP